MQSENYVPGVSGWKIENGNIEINNAKIQVGGLSPEPQITTVIVGEWSETDMPRNAFDRHNFIGEKLFLVPPMYRDNAELMTEDHSYDRDGSDIRTTLTFRRPETPKEAAARVEKAKVAGTRVVFKDGCMTIIQDGVVRVRLGEPSKPFIVEGGQVSINEAAVEAATVDSGKLSTSWSVKTELLNGQHVITGVGQRLDSQFLTQADKFAVKDEKPKSPIEQAIADGDVDKVLDLIAGTVSESDLGKELKSRINPMHEAIRSVIREELRPGGLLHRGR